MELSEHLHGCACLRAVDCGRPPTKLEELLAMGRTARALAKVHRDVMHAIRVHDDKIGVPSFRVITVVGERVSELYNHTKVTQ